MTKIEFCGIIITMKFEWDEIKNQENIAKHKVSLKDNYTKEDFKNAVVKNYGSKISAEEKILMTLRAYMAAGQIKDKKLLKKEMDIVLA